MTDDTAEPAPAERFDELRTNADMSAERERAAPYFAAPPDKTLAFVAEMNLGESANGPYVCPMHPEVVSDDPGSCPKCGMKLLPADLAGAIVAAVESLRWPLGRRSFVAMLRGSVSAPPSARASASFGMLAGASDAEVKRWVRALEAAGALVEVETDDGFTVLRAVAGAPRPASRRPHPR